MQSLAHSTQQVRAPAPVPLCPFCYRFSSQYPLTTCWLRGPPLCPSLRSPQGKHQAKLMEHLPLASGFLGSPKWRPPRPFTLHSPGPQKIPRAVPGHRPEGSGEEGKERGLLGAVMRDAEAPPPPALPRMLSQDFLSLAPFLLCLQYVFKLQPGCSLSRQPALSLNSPGWAGGHPSLSPRPPAAPFSARIVMHSFACNAVAPCSSWHPPCLAGGLAYSKR